jgi:hypothetical protein
MLTPPPVSEADIRLAAISIGLVLVALWRG